MNKNVVFVAQRGTIIETIFRSCGMPTLNPYIYMNSVGIKFRKIIEHKKLKMEEAFYNEEIVHLKPSTVFVISALISLEFLRWLRESLPTARIILLYSNIVRDEKMLFPLDIPDSICEKWSWDAGDCAKYNMNYYTSVYAKGIIPDSSVHQYDIVFIGCDKGRRDRLLELKKNFEKQGLSCNFCVSGDNSLQTILHPRRYAKHISYIEYLSEISKAKSLLEIAQSEQTGMTMRVLEAAFSHKKLITTNKSCKELPFYDDKNIFVLGDDDLNRISDFINSEYDVSADDKTMYYEFHTWIERFM